MGGWFTHEVNSQLGFRGLRHRMAGPGAEVLRRLGATVVTLPGGEIMRALQSGAIDATEWIGPWLDMSIGLHKAVNCYYYPGFHESGSGFSLGINKRGWESLDSGNRQPARRATRRQPRNHRPDARPSSRKSLVQRPWTPRRAAPWH
jgi:TRAP-type mannitol/chloroaromatic compound transport system substrate-binding protein